MQQSKLVIIINVSKLYPTSSHQWIIIVKKQNHITFYCDNMVRLWHFLNKLVVSIKENFCNIFENTSSETCFILRQRDGAAAYSKLDCELSGYSGYETSNFYIS